MALSLADHARISVRHPDPAAAIAMFVGMGEETLAAQIEAGQKEITTILGDVDDDAILAALNAGELLTAAQRVAAMVPPKPSLPDLEPYQFHAMLKIAGIKDDVEQAIAAMEQPGALVIQERYARTTKFHRSDTMFDDLGPAVGITSAQIDGLWAYAASL